MRSFVSRAWMSAVLFGALSLAAKTNYVDWQATGTGDGTSWIDAYSNLPAAVSGSVSNDEIWVAQGAYRAGANRSSSFSMKAFVRIYGGFTNGMTDLTQRDWLVHPSILSGDVDGNNEHDANNAYHVVSPQNDGMMDGFHIQHGYANGSNPNNYGGAVYANNQYFRFANCAFISNYSAAAGGAIGFIVGGRPRPTVFENCRFVENVSATHGGAVYMSWAVNAIFSNCLFAGNQALGPQGGGAFHSSEGSSLDLIDCRFANNYAKIYGGCLHLPSTHAFFRAANCVFSGNIVTNGADSYGGALHCLNLTNTVNGTVFCGNQAQGLWATAGAGRGSFSFANCTFAGNRSQKTGGVFWNSSVLLENCTVTRNYAYDGGAFYVDNKVRPYLTNCIVWSNTASHYGHEFYHSASTSTVVFTDIHGGWNGSRVYNTAGGAVIDGGGNLNTNPVFADTETGAWEAVSPYDAFNGATVLTDADKAWPINAHAGKTVNPDTAQSLEFYVLSNTATQLVLLGNVTTIAAAADAYAIYDLHLQSKRGRWTPLGFVQDSVNSPCLDAGDPASPFANEPKPNGSRINLGAFGNTDQASLSRDRFPGTLLLIR